MKKLIPTLILMTLFLSGISQNKKPERYTDTTRTLIWFITDINSGNSKTENLIRIVYGHWGFVQPSQEQIDTSSKLELTKNKIPDSVKYFYPKQAGALAVQVGASLERNAVILKDFDVDIVAQYETYKHFSPPPGGAPTGTGGSVTKPDEATNTKPKKTTSIKN